MQKVLSSDLSCFKRLSDLNVSPSGRKAVFAVRSTDMENDCYRSEVYLSDGAQLRNLGYGSAPLFETEDTVLIPHMDKGMTIYTRLYLCEDRREEAFRLPFSVWNMCIINEQYVLCGGCRRITAPDLTNKTDTERDLVRALWDKEKDYEILDELPFRFNGAGYINKNRCGLFRCDVKNDRQTLLTDIYFDLKGIRLNRDRTKALIWGNTFETVNPEKSVLYILDIGSDCMKPLTDDSMRIDNACFAGKSVILTETRDSVSEICVSVLDPDTGAKQTLLSDIDGGAPIGDMNAGGSNWYADDAYRYVAVRERYKNEYRAVYPDGTEKVLISDTDYIPAAAGREDNLFFFGANSGENYELYRKTNGKTERITDFFSAYRQAHFIAGCEHLVFRNREGMELDGFILRPQSADQNRKLPAVLSVHGGPADHYGEVLNHEMQLLCAEGYIVFFCNPRGSNGRGHSFADIHGDKYGDVDYNDLMDFTDAVIKAVPEIDENRLGIIGGSYGGSMVNWVIGHTDRFRTAVACRSVGNMLSGALTSDVGYFHTLATLRTTPWEDPESIWRHSPVALADRIHTPLLLIHSDEDYRCESSGAVQMLTALLMHGVPARMLLIHGENHTLSWNGKPSHRLRRLNAITEWLDKYLK